MKGKKEALCGGITEIGILLLMKISVIILQIPHSFYWDYIFILGGEKENAEKSSPTVSL